MKMDEIGIAPINCAVMTKKMPGISKGLSMKSKVRFLRVTAYG